MSVSLLREIEACPRRWALSSAEYPELWERRGYPAQLQLSSLGGRVIHLAVEEATKALVRFGCRSPQAPEAVAVMREIGGWSALVTQCIERVLGEYAVNPRAAHLVDMARRRLSSELPEMRAQIQGLLGRISLETAPGATSGVRRVAEARDRQPLGPGVYPEVEVRAPRIGWKGRIDLLTIADTSCEIVDLKTGAPEDYHSFQIRVYALLWNRDSELNPGGRRASVLTLAYRSGDASVPEPSSVELDDLEREIVARERAARDATSIAPPAARPSAGNCRYCSVRHLCDEYWASSTPRRIEEERAGGPHLKDVELVVTGRHGPASWDVLEAASGGPASSRRIVLRTALSGPEFGVGASLRVLGAHVANQEDDAETGVLTLGLLSEVFLVPRLGAPAT